MAAALPPRLVASETDPTRIEELRQSLDTAERAFSRDAQQIGLNAAFARYGRSDAVNMGGPARATFVVGADSIGAVVSQDEPDRGRLADFERPDFERLSGFGPGLGVDGKRGHDRDDERCE